MIEETTDPLWPEFKPLWSDMRQAGSPLLVAGGYGLFLKQRWLLDHPEVRTVVPMGNWLTAPRVTNDVDLVVGLSLIGDPAAQGAMVDALDRNEFKEAAEEKHRRWRWEKTVGKRTVLVELHAPLPEPGQKGFKMDAFRVKRKPSLGEKGVHAHQNAEAVGSEIHPFRFDLEEVEIAVPNPLTMCIMKLTAMEDYWVDVDDPETRADKRDLLYKQAVKHANDVYRSVAMMTREESAAIPEILEAVRNSTPFAKASEIFQRYFGDEQGRGGQVVAEGWQPDDAALIRDTLDRWFGRPVEQAAA